MVSACHSALRSEGRKVQRENGQIEQEVMLEEDAWRLKRLTILKQSWSGAKKGHQQRCPRLDNAKIRSPEPDGRPLMA